MAMESLDEALFKLMALTIRFFQFFASVFIIGSIGQFLRDINGEGYTLQAYLATIGIASASTVWSFFILIFTCCAGTILLAIELALDTIFIGAFIATTVLLNDDAINTCGSFENKWFSNYGNNPPWQSDCGLVKAGFALCVLNLVAYFVALLIAIAVEMVRIRRQHRHHHHHHHRHTSHSSI